MLYLPNNNCLFPRLLHHCTRKHNEKNKTSMTDSCYQTCSSRTRFISLIHLQHFSSLLSNFLQTSLLTLHISVILFSANSRSCLYFDVNSSVNAVNELNLWCVPSSKNADNRKPLFPHNVE